MEGKNVATDARKKKQKTRKYHDLFPEIPFAERCYRAMEEHAVF